MRKSTRKPMGKGYTNRILVVITDEQRRFVEKQADDRGISMCEYLRNLLDADRIASEISK